MKEVVKLMNEGFQQFLQQQKQMLQHTYHDQSQPAINEITIVTNNHSDTNEMPTSLNENDITTEEAIQVIPPQSTSDTENVTSNIETARSPSPTLPTPHPEILLQINQYNGSPMKRNPRLNLPTPPKQEITVNENSQLPPEEDRKPPEKPNYQCIVYSELETSTNVTSPTQSLLPTTKRRSKSKLTHHATILESISGSDMEDDDIIDEEESATTLVVTSPRKRPDVKSTPPSTTSTETTSTTSTTPDIESGEKPRTLFHDMLDSSSSDSSGDSEIHICPDTSVESVDSGQLG